MDIKAYRSEIDKIDGELAALFCRRMEIAAEIGAYKRERGLSVRDEARENQLVEALCGRHPQHARELRELYRTLLALSRAAQGEAEDA